MTVHAAGPPTYSTRGSPSGTALGLFGPAGEQIIDSDSGASTYQGRLNSGHVAFTRESDVVYVGTASGVTRQLEMRATIEGISSAGEVMFITAVEGASRRYLIRPNADPLDVSSALGAPLAIDGAWHIALNGWRSEPHLPCPTRPPAHPGRSRANARGGR